MSTPRTPRGNVPAIQAAIKLAGGQAAVARQLQLTRAAVNRWWNGDLPAERAVQLETLCKGAVRRDAMRPDLFGESSMVA